MFVVAISTVNAVVDKKSITWLQFLGAGWWRQRPNDAPHTLPRIQAITVDRKTCATIGRDAMKVASC